MYKLTALYISDTLCSGIHCTYNSISSSGMSSFSGPSKVQSLNLISSVVAVGRFFVNHGGLLS